MRHERGYFWEESEKRKEQWKREVEEKREDRIEKRIKE